MLQEELCPPDANDPTCVGIKSPVDVSNQFFINPSTLIVRKRPEQYTRSRRGAAAILAEDPGAGKTIMVRLCDEILYNGPFTLRTQILALILCTKYELPVAIPSSPYYTPRVLTPSIAQNRVTAGAGSAVSSLRDLALHCARISNIALPENTSALPDHLTALLVKNSPYYMDFYPEHESLASQNLRTTALHPEEKIFLSAATLLVVPVMLKLQWDAEITKHVEDGALRVLVVKTQSDIPAVESLASNYDVSSIEHA